MLTGMIWGPGHWVGGCQKQVKVSEVIYDVSSKTSTLNFRWKLTAVQRNLLFLNITQCHACTKGKRYVMSILLAS